MSVDLQERIEKLRAQNRMLQREVEQLQAETRELGNALDDAKRTYQDVHSTQQLEIERPLQAARQAEDHDQS